MFFLGKIKPELFAGQELTPFPIWRLLIKDYKIRGNLFVAYMHSTSLKTQ